jgi:hypothetical protein
MQDSPCHYCPKCPGKEHDTCGEYLDYRALLDKRRKENMKVAVVKDYVNRSIAKRKRRERK